MNKKLLATLFLGAFSALQANTIEFPDVEDSYLKQVKRYSLSQVKLISQGLNQDSVRHILGNPHFSEFSSSTWNYILDINLESNKYKRCQLQVYFDKDEALRKIFWKPTNCLKSLESEPQEFELSSDSVFEFNQSNLNNEGKVKLAELVNLVLNKDANDKVKITVNGHTDRIGSQTYNLALSEKRAKAVAQFLVKSGLPKQNVTAIGHGENNPKVTCKQKQRKKLITCLAPNRRVNIKVLSQ